MGDPSKEAFAVNVLTLRQTLLFKLLLLAGLLTIAAVSVSSTALAGECPADKRGENPLENAATKYVGVFVEELSSIYLGREAVKLENHSFRLRRFTIQPGGTVPFHDHSKRPSIVYILQGTVLEHNSKCIIPIAHKTGDSVMESVGVAHWWQNIGDEEAILLSADIIAQKIDPNM